MRRLGVPDVDRELLLAALLLVGVRRLGAGEVDAPAVGRPDPGADARLLLRQLVRLRGVDAVDRQAVELLLAGLARPVREPLAVAAERERRDAFLGVRDPARLAAVGAHQVQLPLAGRAGRAPRGWTRKRRTMPSRDHRGDVSSFSFVKVICLVDGRPSLQRDEEEVRLPLGFLPVRRADGVEHPAPVRARRRRPGLSHHLHVEERHGPFRGVGPRCWPRQKHAWRMMEES